MLYSKYKKYPKFKNDVYALISIRIGTVFMILACISVLGILVPSINSIVQNPILFGQIFCVFAIAFSVSHAFFKNKGKKQFEMYMYLTTYGSKISGTVEKIEVVTNVKYKGKSPFVINYKYSYSNVDYHDKSQYIWEETSYKVGDEIEVCLDYKGNSTVEVFLQ